MINALKQTGHHFTDQREEVYFNLSMTIPRVGEDVLLRFHADRYVVHGGAWTVWRIIRDSSQTPPGIGTKTIATIYIESTPAIQAWLDGPEYVPSRSKAVAHFIAQEAQNPMYGRTTKWAKQHLENYRTELSEQDYDTLNRGIECLREGTALLDSINA